MDNISTLNVDLKRAYDIVMRADESSPLIKNARPSSFIVSNIMNYSKALVVRKTKKNEVVKLILN